jgi:hypothetical protein
MAYWTPYTVGYSWAEEDEMPVGAIALWSLLNGAIPTGWVECDGTANAPGPDMRGRFPVGRDGAHVVDTTGGSLTHAHDAHGVTASEAFTFNPVSSFTTPGTHSADDHQPPWFALIYIQRMT